MSQADGDQRRDDARDDDARSPRSGARPQVRRTRDDLTREEREFLERHRIDQPPHHDSSWG